MLGARRRVEGWWRPAAASLLTLVFAACGVWREESVLSTPTPAAPSIIVNGGFEEGLPPWFGDPSPTLSSDRPHAGKADLTLAPATAATQSMVTADFPEFLSGYYSIDAPLAAGSYLEFVVTVSQPDPAQARAVHFIIAATDPAPAATSADATVFLSRATPVAGGWHYFSYPLREAFNARAEGVPATWESIQVTLRFVAPPAGAGTSVIARFDDIYAGPQFANPNRDPDLSTH